MDRACVPVDQGRELSCKNFLEFSHHLRRKKKLSKSRLRCRFSNRIQINRATTIILLKNLKKKASKMKFQVKTALVKRNQVIKVLHLRGRNQDFNCNKMFLQGRANFLCHQTRSQLSTSNLPRFQNTKESSATVWKIHNLMEERQKKRLKNCRCRGKS